MNNPSLYRIISHLDKPRRIMSFSMDELVIVVMGMMFLVASSHKVWVGLFSFMLLAGLKHLKQGHGPRYLLVLFYWYLPAELNQVFVAKLPKSYLRKWRG